MALIFWYDSMSVRIPEIDRHHQHLIDLLNQLYEGFIEVQSAQTIEILLQELVDYVAYHFAAEERFMEADQYTLLAEHRLEHAQLSQHVQEFFRDFREGRHRIAMELLAFLSKWATAHILEMDGAYGQFVQDRQSEG
jgi:hemerythrin